MDELPLLLPPEPEPPPPEPPESQEKRRLALAAGLVLLWGFFTLLAQFSGALDTFEEPLLDWRQSLASYTAPPNDQLALIAIDTIPSDRPWPWSRLDYSLLLRSLIDYKPGSVVFEMSLNDRDTQYSAFDDTFSHVIQRTDKVIFAASVLSRKSSAPIPAKMPVMAWQGSLRLVPRFGSAVWPLETFAGDSPVGVNNLESESGQRLRRLPMIFLVGDRMIPSLVLQATATQLGADLAASDIQIGRAIFLRRHDGKLLRTVPIDNEGRLRIRFHPGPVASWQASFDSIFLADEQLQHNLATETDLRALAKRQVWVGRTDTGDHKNFNTAIGSLSRVEIQLQAERTILDQDYVRPLPPMILALLYLLIGTAIAAAMIKLGPVHAAAVVIILAAFWVESAVLAFRVYNVILPLPSLAMLLFGAYIVSLLASHWDLETEESDPVSVER